MESEAVAIRLPKGMARRLRVLSHERSLEEGTDLTWGDIVRQALERVLQEHEARKSAGRP